MMKIEELLKLNKNIFTTQDLGVIWQIPNYEKLIAIVRYYLRTKRLFKVTKGVYVLNPKYEDLELAQKLVPWSYTS